MQLARLSSLVILLFCSFFSIAQPNWIELNGPLGLLGVSPSVSVNGTVFMNRRQYNQFDVSFDFGNTWESHDLPLPTQFSLNEFIQRLDDQTYLLFDKQLYAFRKNVHEWQLLPGFNNSVHVATDSQNRLWALAEDGSLSYSSNEGQTFTLVLPDFYSNIMPGLYNDAHNLMVEATQPNNRVYHFTTSGQKTLIPFNINNFYVEWVQYNPYSGTAYIKTNDAPNRIKRSLDGGLTWTDVVFSPDFSGDPVSRLLFTQTGETWAINGMSALISYDEGLTWVPYSPISPYDSYHYGTLSVTADGQKILYYSTDCGWQSFYRSINQGASWDDLSNNYEYPQVTRISKSKGRIYAETCRRNSVDVSSDEGQTWKQVLIPYNGGLWEPQSLCAAPDGTLYSAGDNKIFRSENGGLDWEAIDFDLFFISKYNRIVAGPEGNIYIFDLVHGGAYSTDKGVSWEPMIIPLNFAENSYLGDCFHPNGNFYRSGQYSMTRFDPVSNWPTEIQMPDDYAVLAFTVTESGRVLVVTFNFFSVTLALLSSDDEGEHFQVMGLTPEWATQAQLYRGNGLILMVLNGHYYKSLDDGQTWELYFDSSAFPSSVLSFHISEDNYLYAGFAGSPIRRTEQPLVGSNEPSGGNAALSLFPNPASDQVRFRIPGAAGPFLVDVYDLQGQKMLSRKLDPGKPLDVAVLPRGWYGLSAVDASGKVYAGRFLVEK